MKITKTKLAAASFGAALTSMYSAPELSAQVVDLSFTPSIVPLVTPSGDFNPIAVLGTTSNGANPINVDIYNRSFSGLRSRTFVVGPTSFGSGYGIANVASVDPGDVFSNGFVSDKRIFYSSGIFIGASVTGIETFGFLSSGQAGFFRVDFGQEAGPITLLDGQFNIGGSSITIPAVPTSVPEPSSVGLTALALGAVGLRRRRKATKAA